MELYLIRHGIAEDVGPDGTDDSRRLTRDGVTRFRAGALGMRQLGIAPSLILHSPLERARHTAVLLREGLALPSVPLIESPLLRPESPPALPPQLLAPDAPSRVAIVGHLPHLPNLITWLWKARGMPLIDLKKGSLAVIEVALEGPQVVAAGLLALYPPRALRALGGE